MPFTTPMKALLASAKSRPTTTAFVANSSAISSSIAAIDISNPTSMTGISTLVDAVELNAPRQISLDRSTRALYASCSAGDRITSVDVADPSNMAVLDSVHNATSLNLATALAFDEHNKIIYALSGNNNSQNYITAIDASNPSAMDVLGVYSGFSNSSQSRISDALVDPSRGLLFVCGGAPSGGNARVWVIDVSDPSAMIEVGVFTGGSNLTFHWLALTEEVLFTATSVSPFGGALSVDASDPSAMTLLDSTSGGGVGGAVGDRWGKRVFATAGGADGSEGVLRSFDVSDPSNISVEASYSSIPFLNLPRGLAWDRVRGLLFTTAFAGGNSDFTSFDINTPSTITLGQNYTSSTYLNAPWGVALM